MTDKDINAVVSKAKLFKDDLDRLFNDLNIEPQDIERAKHSAGTNDVGLQAIRVLKEWRQSKGRDATRQEIITALQLNNRADAVQILCKRWKMTGTADQ